MSRWRPNQLLVLHHGHGGCASRAALDGLVQRHSSPPAYEAVHGLRRAGRLVGVRGSRHRSRAEPGRSVTSPPAGRARAPAGRRVLLDRFAARGRTALVLLHAPRARMICSTRRRPSSGTPARRAAGRRCGRTSRSDHARTSAPPPAVANRRSMSFDGLVDESGAPSGPARRSRHQHRLPSRGPGRFSPGGWPGASLPARRGDALSGRGGANAPPASRRGGAGRGPWATACATEAR
jgi:hypothetical protein